MTDKGCIQDLFFALIRCSVGTADKLPYAPSKEEWMEIYSISKEQTVSGIILDAISKLPDEQKPHFELRMQWIAVQKSIEKQNMVMNNVVVEIFEELRKRGVEAYLLKGQGVAQYYNHPLHRVCGDIDLYFKDDCDLKKAISLFKTYGCEIEDNIEESHTETTFKGIKIELHKKCATFYTQKLQVKFNKIATTQIGYNDASFTINNTCITTLPPVLNALQLLSHMLRHIILSGLGMRQICDWVLFINKYQERLDRSVFLKYLEELELLGIYKAITAIAIDYLGMPQDFALYEINDKDRKTARKVLELVMMYGNFGHYGEHTHLTSNLNYIKAYIWKVKNCAKFHSMAKSETWSYPLWQLHSIKKIFIR